MDILRVVSVLFALSWVISARNDCPASSECEAQRFSIRFPFKLEQQSENCGYPGFDLSCNPQGMTILSLPHSGGFYVRDINYLTQEIQLDDPHGCLPSRLLRLNLSSSPFTATYYRNYTFLSCSPELVLAKFTIIDCLSNSTASILATSSLTLARKMKMCTVLFTLAIPIPWHHHDDYDYDGFSAELNGYLSLSWNLPSCADCEAKGDFCGFANGTSQEISCYDPKSGGSKGLQLFKLVAATMVVPAISCSMVMCCIICLATRRVPRENGSAASAQNSAAVAPQPTSAVAGLDDSTIETYKKVVLGESRRLPGPNDITCPICLTEYNPREAIRSIPDCQHCFHVDCIDEWLRMNGSCPVCRSSPIPTT